MSIDVNGVAKLMQELDASKAPGPDGMPAQFLKRACPAGLPSALDKSIKPGQVDSQHIVRDI